MAFTVKQRINLIQVPPDTGCWEFRGSQNAGGYGDALREIASFLQKEKP
jgi:hypothetical protein